MESGDSSGLSTAEGRKFGLTVGVAFLILGGATAWRGHEEIGLVCSLVGFGFSVGGLAVPAKMGAVHEVWMGLAHAVSKVTTPVLLAAIYFAVISPIGGLLRAFGRHPLEQDRSEENSYWTRRSSSESDLERQF